MKKLTRHELSIHVATIIDPYSLVILDTSVYREDGPESPILKITKPTTTDSISIPFNFGAQNVITSYDFGGNTRTILQDGIYKLEYSVAPNCYVYYCLDYFRTDNLECKLIKWISTIDWKSEMPCSINYKKLFQIQALLTGAKINAQEKKSTLAQEQYDLANTLLCTQEMK